MLYKDMKTIVHSSDGNTDYNITGIFQGDTLTPFLFIIYLDYILQTSVDLMKENIYILKRQETKDILQKLLLMQTMHMILHFLQIYLLKPNLCSIAWSKQQEALVPM